ncbi:MAG: hypothetical protein AB7G06_05015, partial [Bdellovibrionales bacterium]
WWDGLGTGPEHSQSYRQFVRTGDFTFQCIVVGKTGEEKHTLQLPNTETAILTVTSCDEPAREVSRTVFDRHTL